MSTNLVESKDKTQELIFDQLPPGAVIRCREGRYFMKTTSSTLPIVGLNDGCLWDVQYGFAKAVMEDFSIIHSTVIKRVI